MWVFAYDTALFFYRLGVRIYGLFNEKAAKWIEGRHDLFRSLQQETFNETIWFHCASVGEFEQGYPLLIRLKVKHPLSTILVTFFSPSGYEFAKKRYSDFLIFYLPVDTQKNATQFLDIIQPKAAFFIKYEFWFHFLDQLKKRTVPTFLIAGIFRKEQIFFRWFGMLHRRMLHAFSYLFVQQEESKQLLQSIGISNAGVFGDTRFDRVAELRKSVFSDEVINHFSGDAKIFIAGSVWQSDEEPLKKIIASLPPDWKIIITPHEISNYSVSWLNEEVAFYSRYERSEKRVLIVDTLGLLSRMYRKADMAYIGGGYGKGIHNMLEAAIYEIPVLIGPRHQKFNEAVELMRAGAAFDTSQNGTEGVVQRLVGDHAFYQAVKQDIARYMSTHTNVSEKIEVFLSEQKLMK